MSNGLGETTSIQSSFTHFSSAERAPMMSRICKPIAKFLLATLAILVAMVPIARSASLRAATPEGRVFTDSRVRAATFARAEGPRAN